MIPLQFKPLIMLGFQCTDPLHQQQRKRSAANLTRRSAHPRDRQLPPEICPGQFRYNSKKISTQEAPSHKKSEANPEKQTSDSEGDSCCPSKSCSTRGTVWFLTLIILFCSRFLHSNGQSLVRDTLSPLTVSPGAKSNQPVTMTESTPSP